MPCSMYPIQEGARPQPGLRHPWRIEAFREFPKLALNLGDFVGAGAIGSSFVAAFVHETACPVAYPFDFFLLSNIFFTFDDMNVIGIT